MKSYILIAIGGRLDFVVGAFARHDLITPNMGRMCEANFPCPLAVILLEYF